MKGRYSMEQRAGGQVHVQVSAQNRAIEKLSKKRNIALYKCPAKRIKCALLSSGGIAQLGERLHGMQEVSGSIPLTSTRRKSLLLYTWSLSSRGLGHRPFTAVTGVRIPVGTPPLHHAAVLPVTRKAARKARRHCGVVVQLVRIPACHAGGRGFEPRPLRHKF